MARPTKPVSHKILTAANYFPTVTESNLRSFLRMPRTKVTDKQFESTVLNQAYRLAKAGKLTKVAPKTFAITPAGYASFING